MTTFNVMMLTKNASGEVVKKVAFANMPQADALKVCERMNRLNILAAKQLGKAVKIVFGTSKNA